MITPINGLEIANQNEIASRKDEATEIFRFVAIAPDD